MAGETEPAVAEVLEALGVDPGVLAWLNFGAGIAAFVALYALFEKLEDIASPEANRDIAAWLRRVEIPGTLVNWPSQFAALFDRVFGECHLSEQCFLRSCVASLAGIAVMNMIWSVLHPKDFLIIRDGHPGLR